MLNTPLQLTLREWRKMFSTKTPYVIFCAAAVLLTILAPFETAGRLSVIEAFFYWFVITGGTYSIGAFIGIGLKARLSGCSKGIRLLALGGMIGCAITPFVSLLNYISFAVRPSLAEYLLFNLQLCIIATIVSAILEMIESHQAPQSEAEQSPALLSRVPLELRGDIMALTAQDHYTCVKTTKGEALVLIRLADAIQECAPISGMKVHRSHWVALDHVTKTATQDGRKFLTLRSGETIPVSRSFLEAVKKAGLFDQ